MEKITPHLWFNTEAKEAAQLYTSLFPGSKITHISTLHNTPSGDCDIVSFELAGLPLMAISAGPIFKFNPSISFLIACKTKEQVDSLWSKLSQDGKPIMPLDKYPFSDRYGWTEDRFGLSWQIMYFGDMEIRQIITPVMMFVGDLYGKAEEAMNYYTSVFKNSSIRDLNRYTKEDQPNREGTIKYGAFTLNGQEFGAMESALDMRFSFNEAISFIVKCESQKEIDFYWEKLSAVPQAEQCGWCKDKYGVSWQVTPSALGRMLSDKDSSRVERVTQAFLKMKKFNIAELEKAFEGEVVY